MWTSAFEQEKKKKRKNNNCPVQLDKWLFVRQLMLTHHKVKGMHFIVVIFSTVIILADL